jgi:hypothetical protein
MNFLPSKPLTGWATSSSNLCAGRQIPDGFGAIEIGPLPTPP